LLYSNFGHLLKFEHLIDTLFSSRSLSKYDEYILLKRNGTFFVFNSVVDVSFVTDDANGAAEPLCQCCYRHSIETDGIRLWVDSPRIEVNVLD